MACWIPAHGQGCPRCGGPEAGRGIMFTGLLAVLIVGTLAGSVEADRGDGRYRTPDYPRYSRDYYDGYGSGYGAYGGGGGRRSAPCSRGAVGGGGQPPGGGGVAGAAARRWGPARRRSAARLVASAHGGAGARPC